LRLEEFIHIKQYESQTSGNPDYMYASLRRLLCTFQMPNFLGHQKLSLSAPPVSFRFPVTQGDPKTMWKKKKALTKSNT
jgi:hypothetical protein